MRAGRMAWVAVAILAMLMVAAGCGDDEDSDTGLTTSALPKKAYLGQANEICGKAVERTRKKAEDSDSQNVAQAYATAAVPIFREVEDQISALGAPKGDEAQVEAFLEALDEGLDDLEAAEGSINSFNDLEEPLTRAGDQALDYGISACAFGS